MSGSLLYLLVDLRVERLAGDDAVLERGEIVFRQVFLDQETPDRRRRAEGGHAVRRGLVEKMRGVEPLVGVDEDRAAGEPLAVEKPPHRFRPAGVGDGVVKSAVDDVLPVFRGDDVAEGIDVIVRDHLGKSRRARGEIQEHEVMIPRCAVARRSGETFGRAFELVFEREPAVASSADDHLLLEHADVFLRLIDIVVQVAVDADEHLDAGHLHAVFDVVCGEHVRRGDGDGSQLVESDDAGPELMTLLEDQHHGVAFLYSLRGEHVRRLVASALHLREGDDVFLFVVAPHERLAVRLMRGVPVDHVVGEVEVLGNSDVEVRVEVLVRRELCFLHIL